MKCFHHASEAAGVCAHCGRGLCLQCAPTDPASRLTCSPVCAAALDRTQRAVDLLLHRSQQGAMANAFYCLISGVLSLVGSVVAWFVLPSPFLIFFTAACGVVLIPAGLWYARGLKGTAATRL